jgi:prepilin peptidase CpaA
LSLAPVGAVVLAVTACVFDLRSRRVPNALTFGGTAVGLVFHGVANGWLGLGWSALGWVIGLLLFLPFFVLRGLGGGDVKLMAALGAWVGPSQALWLAFWSALSGGVLALIVAGTRGYAGQAFRNVFGVLTYWRVMGMQPHPAITLESGAGPRLPYALPIAAGLGLTLWWT